MTRWRGLRMRLQQLLWRSEAESRADEEMRLHLEMEAERHQRAGVSHDEAQRRARVAFGGVDYHKETMRDQRRVPGLEVLWDDTRFAMRVLRRHPTLTGVAVLTLSLGIGAAVAMFSVLDAVMLSDTQVRRPSEIITVWTAPPARPTEHLPLTYAELTDCTRVTKSLSSVAGVNFQGSADVVLLDGTRALPMGASWVTGNYFQVLGVTPMLGRVIEPADDAPGAARVMVISHSNWRRTFGGDTSVIGRPVTWNRNRYTIVGVLPPGFEYPRFAGAWMPVLSAFPATRDPGAWGAEVMQFDLIGRLRPAIDRTTAAQELNVFLRQGDAQRPSTWRGATAVVTPWTQRISGDITSTLIAAALAVAVLLLMACVNVASLLLVRGAQRTRELAIRAALGAGRRRLVHLLLTEAGLLALAGGVLGVVLAWVAVRLVVGLAPPAVPRRELIAVDVRSIGVAVAITVFATLASGLLPALVAARDDLGHWLRGGHAISGMRRRSPALRQALVMGQIALAVLVMISAGLITRSLRALQSVEMGFADARLSIVETMLPPGAEPDRAKRFAMQEAMVAGVTRIPGVLSASVMPKPPFSGDGGWTAIFSADGQSADEAAANPAVNFEVVGDGYFEAMQIPLLAGRAFDSRDREDGIQAAIVSATLARKTWPAQSAIGKRVKLGPLEASKAPWATVVGVAGETRYRDLAVERPTLYLPARQFRGPEPMTMAVRTTPGTGNVAPQISGVLAAIHPELLVVSSASMTERLAAPLARPRFGVLLFGAFGGITMLLAIVGVYGVMASTVRERQRELGIRMALGASASALRALVLREGLLLTIVGSGFGVAVALASTRLLTSLLYGISPNDPLTYVAIVAVILLAATLACWIPAWRAGRVDPVRVLGTD